MSTKTLRKSQSTINVEKNIDMFSAFYQFVPSEKIKFQEEFDQRQKRILAAQSQLLRIPQRSKSIICDQQSRSNCFKSFDEFLTGDDRRKVWDNKIANKMKTPKPQRVQKRAISPIDHSREEISISPRPLKEQLNNHFKQACPEQIGGNDIQQTQERQLANQQNLRQVEQQIQQDRSRKFKEASNQKAFDDELVKLDKQQLQIEIEIKALNKLKANQELNAQALLVKQKKQNGKRTNSQQKSQEKKQVQIQSQKQVRLTPKLNLSSRDIYPSELMHNAEPPQLQIITDYHQKYNPVKINKKKIKQIHRQYIQSIGEQVSGRGNPIKPQMSYFNQQQIRKQIVTPTQRLDKSPGRNRLPPFETQNQHLDTDKIIDRYQGNTKLSPQKGPGPGKTVGIYDLHASPSRPHRSPLRIKQPSHDKHQNDGPRMTTESQTLKAKSATEIQVENPEKHGKGRDKFVSFSNNNDQEGVEPPAPSQLDEQEKINNEFKEQWIERHKIQEKGKYLGERDAMTILLLNRQKQSELINHNSLKTPRKEKIVKEKQITSQQSKIQHLKNQIQKSQRQEPCQDSNLKVFRKKYDWLLEQNQLKFTNSNKRTRTPQSRNSRMGDSKRTSEANASQLKSRRDKTPSRGSSVVDLSQNQRYKYIYKPLGPEI